MNESIELRFRELELTKLNLNKGDTLAVTVKSDDMAGETIDALKRGLAEAFPGVRVMIFGIGLKDEIRFAAISENKELSSCGTEEYCIECSCGKKEQILGAQNG